MPLKSAAWLVCLVALVLPGAAAAQNPVHWSAAPVTAVPGKSVNIVLTARIDDGWHLYGLNEPPGPSPLTLSFDKTGPFRLSGAVTESTPTKKLDPNFGAVTEYHEGTATFTLPFGVASSLPRGPQSFKITVNFQVCNDTVCLPPKDEEITVKINDGSAASVEPASPTPEATGLPAAVPGPPSAASAPPSRVPDFASSSSATTFRAYVGLAALMGALSLLTPCVFPMVPITVSYFTSRAERNRRGAVMNALVYGLGIVLTFSLVGFTLAVAFGASGLNRFAANPWLNLGVTALFVGFALGLFGVWDLALPSRLVTAATRAESSRGGVAGTLLMGLAFTLTSFTCTAPFLGTLLVVASQGDWQWPLAGMIAFSTIFALPFVLLAVAPQWLASLPRSGPWLIAVKAVMGLLELAAAVKFLSNVDLVWGWGIFTRPTVLIVWIAIAIVLVLYLAGLLTLGRAPRLQRPGLGRLAGIAVGIALGVWLGTGLAGRRLGELEAFLPPADLKGAHGGELAWILNDYDAGLAQAKQQNRPMLIDFTGYTCTNCRWMEANMFTRPEIERELARYVRLRLYTDGQGEVYRRYQKLEESLFGTVALPYYAVFSPDGQPVVGFGGLTRDPNQYLAFLRRGLE
ncbi:MAG TPA: cytochrome c biogenesis protein CcdA [Vicinamibacterales bacterium]|nr:cytochrome c biogenesis protein CcdA [Vicinamibacterales bacterium]